MRKFTLGPLLSLFFAGMVVETLLASDVDGKILFNPGVDVTEEYNNNILNGAKKRVEDYITFLSPRVFVGFQGSLLSLGGEYVPRYRFYSRNRNLNGSEPKGVLQVKLGKKNFWSWENTLAEEKSLGVQTLDEGDKSVDVKSLVEEERSEKVVKRKKVILRYSLQESREVALSYEGQGTLYDNASLLDSRHNRVTFTYSHPLLKKGGIDLGFRQSSSWYGGTLEKMERRNPFFKILYTPNGKIELRAEGGVNRYRFLKGGKEGRLPQWAGTFRIEGGRNRIAIRWRSYIDPFSGLTHGLETSSTLLSYRRLMSGSSVIKTSFRHNYSKSLSTRGFTIEGYHLYASMEKALGRRISLSLHYSHSDQKTRSRGLSHLLKDRVMLKARLRTSLEERL